MTARRAQVHTRFAAVVAVTAALLVTASLHAPTARAASLVACAPTARAADAAAVELQPGVAAGDAAARDAAALLGRARARCGALRIGVAIAHATVRAHPTVAGSRARVDDVQLVTTRTGTAVVWRYDVLTQATRAAQVARRKPATTPALVTALVATAQPARGGVLRWAADPTAGVTDGRTQLAVTSLLAGLQGTGARGAATRSLAAVTDKRIATGIVGGPLLGAIARTTVLARTTHALGGSCTTAPARALCAVTAARVRRTAATPWPVVDGAAATGPVATALRRSVDRLAAVAPEQARVAAARLALRAHLAAAPSVHLAHLPGAAFYPLPLDGVLDAATVALRADRPVQVAMQVFAPSGAIVDTVVASGGPGPLSIDWNGALAGHPAGSAPVGAYRWQLRVRDPLGHRAVVPGVGSLTIARDTTPPKILSTKVTVEGSGTRRTLHVTWKVDEPISPRITVALTLRGGDVRRTLPVPATSLAGTGDVSTLLPAGTYRAFVRITDGAGNAAAVAAGTVTAS